MTPLHLGYSLATLATGYVGGSETYARGVLDGLCARDPGEVSVRVIANRTAAAAYRALVAGRAELVEVPGRFRGGIAERAAAMVAMRLDARRLAGRVARDLSLMHYAVTIPLPHVDGLPTVQTMQDMQHREHPEWFSRPERLFRRVAYDAAARRATRVITATRHARDQIVEHLGIAPDRIDVIGHGIDHARFAPGPDPADAERLAPLGLPERFAFYPANMWPHKNHERLVEALAATEDRELHLVLTGQGYGRLDALLERAGALGVGSRVRHLGHLPGDALPALYRAARALVFPSLFEGFGIPVLEAMACGCPVACSDVASLPEVVADAARLFDPHDPHAIAAAVEDVLGSRDEWSRRGVERARQFSWEATARAHDEVYRELSS
jgi:glycosyltransferase involved in cell wall biosynthesis